MHLANRNSRSQRQRDEASHCLCVRHCRAARLAEVDEYLEGLATIILGDVEEHGTERRLDARGDSAQGVGTRSLGATLKILGFGVEQRLLEPRVVGLELCDGAVQLAPFC